MVRFFGTPASSLARAVALAAGLQAISLSVSTSVSLAQQTARSPLLEYVAKMVCGTQPEFANLQLVRGRYLTAVNLLNRGEGSAKIQASIALAHPPPSLRAGDVHVLPAATLGVGKSLAIDCGDLKAHIFGFGFPDSYIDGFLVIKSTGALSVSAVYTAAPLVDKKCCKTVAGPVASIDVEEIAAIGTVISWLVRPAPSRRRTCQNQAQPGSQRRVPFLHS